jgi:hypothetical protein
MSERDAAIKRGEEARRILNSQIWAEAWEAYDRRILEAMANADLEPAKLTRLQGYLVAARKARGHLERLIQDGKLAATEIELDERKKRLRDVFRIA